MHMAVDQAGQDEAVALVDHGRAGEGGGVDETVPDLHDPAVAHDDGRGAARRLTRTIQQTPRLDQGDRTRARRSRILGKAHPAHRQRRQRACDQ